MDCPTCDGTTITCGIHDRYSDCECPDTDRCHGCETCHGAGFVRDDDDYDHDDQDEGE